MTDPLKLFSLTSTVQELFSAAKHFNAGQIQMVYRNSKDQPLGAVIVVLKQIPRKQQLKRERDGQIPLPLSALIYPEPAGYGKDPNRVQLPIKQEVVE